MTYDATDIEEAVADIRNGERLLFTSRTLRDAVWKAAKAAGVSGLHRSSTRNQLLDPRYTFEGRNIPDRGLGNDYRHYHSCLYELATSRY